MNYLTRLREIAENLCTEMNLHLVDVQEKGNRNMPLFMIFADSERGITLGECEKLSKAIQDEIDFSDDFPVKYRLDVSSPGLDKPLLEDYQFTKNMGKNISLKMKNSEANKKIVGKLKSFNDKLITLEDSKGREQNFNRDDIIQARVELQW